MIQAVKDRLVGTRLGALLHRTGIARACYAIHDWPILRRGHYKAVIHGQAMRLAAQSPDAIRRFEWIVDRWPRQEQEFIEQLLGAIRPNDVCFDVGANIGIVTLLVAIRHRQRNVTIHAFEPEPHNAGVLRDNVRLNGLDNVQVHEIALGVESGAARLFANPAFGSGQHSLVNAQASAGATVSITLVAGDEFIQKTRSWPDILKIDVEGAEMLVLQGMREAFDTGRVRELFIEIHQDMLAECGRSAEEVRQWLAERRYEPVWAEKRGSEYHEHYRRQ